MKKLILAVLCGAIASFPFGIALIVSYLRGWGFVRREYSFLFPLVMGTVIIYCHYRQKSEKQFSIEKAGV